MATLNDGLGFEEVAPASGTTLPAQSIYALGSITATNQISGLNIFATGSATSGRVLGATIISGAQIFGTGSVTGERVTDANGRIFSVSNGSPGLFGNIIQAGSIATGAGSTGTATFRTNYATANSYVVFMTLQSGIGVAGNTTPGAIGSTIAWTSGTANNGRNTSGINIVGQASTTYDYLVVGI